VQALSEASIQARIDQAADRAVAARTRQLVSEVAAERRETAAERQKLLLVAAELDFSDRREQARTVAALEYGPPRQPAGEAK